MPAGGICCPRAADARERPRTYMLGSTPTRSTWICMLYSEVTASVCGTHSFFSHHGSSTYYYNCDKTLDSESMYICMYIGWYMTVIKLHAQRDIQYSVSYHPLPCPQYIGLRSVLLQLDRSFWYSALLISMYLNTYVSLALRLHTKG